MSGVFTAIARGLSDRAVSKDTVTEYLNRELIPVVRAMLQKLNSALDIFGGSGANEVLIGDGAGGGSWDFVKNINVDDAAAIAGTKISPDFGSQNIVTTGAIRSNSATPVLRLGLASGSGAGSAASAGVIRLVSGAVIRVRDAADTADTAVMNLLSTQLQFGNNSYSRLNLTQANFTMYANTTEVVIGTPTQVAIPVGSFLVGTSTLDGEIFAGDFNVGNGRSLTVRAGDGANGFAGGDLNLRPGKPLAGTVTEGNISLLQTAANYQAMERGVFFGATKTIPTGNPAANTYFIYTDVADGKLKARGSGGTVTVLAVP